MKKTYYSLLALIAAAFTFTSCEDVPMPYDLPESGTEIETQTVEPAGSGTFESPYNIAAIQDFVADLDMESGETATADVYFKGKIVSIKEISDASSYGNASLYLSDDGSTTNQFYVYRCYGPGNKKFTSDDLIQEGDEVVVYCSKFINYSGTLETNQNSSYIVSINGEGKPADNAGGVSGEAKGKGTADDPYNVVAALKICEGLQKSSTSASYLSDEVYVKGKIESITDTELSSFGNLTYYISDDGTSTNKLEVYRGFSFGGEKFSSLDDIKVGDEVIVCGKLQNWLGTYEFTQGSKLYSLNGKTSGDDTPDNPDDPGDDPEVPTGENILENGDFEAWSGSTPVNWKSASTASSATLKQSDDAHDGEYSVNVNGNASANKRLAYKELKLEAGKYSFSFYAKATSQNKAQVRPGYVPIDGDGKAGTYAYSKDYINLSTDWKLYVHEFELAEETTVCLVIMNPKASSYSSGEDVLIDDASLIKK